MQLYSAFICGGKLPLRDIAGASPAIEVAFRCRLSVMVNFSFEAFRGEALSLDHI